MNKPTLCLILTLAAWNAALTVRLIDTNSELNETNRHANYILKTVNENNQFNITNTESLMNCFRVQDSMNRFFLREIKELKLTQSTNGAK